MFKLQVKNKIVRRKAWTNLFNLFSQMIITNVPYRYSWLFMIIHDLWYISFNIQSRNLWNITLKGQDINIQLINLTFAEPFYIQQCWIVISLVQNWYQNYIILVSKWYKSWYQNHYNITPNDELSWRLHVPVNC